MTVLELLRRQLGADDTLADHPEVRANLLTRCRSYQRQGLTQDEMDVACGLILLRRDLLLWAGTATAEGVNLRVRMMEQIHKGRNALRRAMGRPIPAGRFRDIPVPAGRPTPGTADDDED